MSTSTGRAPHNSMALTVATAVWLTVMTSSPGPTPHARSARWSASVPLPALTHSPTPAHAANSASNASVSGPSRYRPPASTRATAASISAAFSW